MLDELKSALDERDTAIGKKLTAVEGENKALRARVEELEIRGNVLTGGGGARDGLTAKDHEHKQLFGAWLRKPHDAKTQTELGNFAAHYGLERKDVTIGSGAAGGFGVPEELRRQIEVLEKKLSPVRDLVTVEQIGTSDFRALVNIRGATASWATETGTRNATATPELREIVPVGGELYAYMTASNWSLDDIFFNVQNWLANEAASQFAIAEGQAVLTGAGASGVPKGLLHTAPVATADFASPLRAATALEFVPCLSPSSPPVAEITADALISLFYKLNSIYRANATWAMNSNTASVIRRLKNSQGDYIWQQGLAAGQPDMLLGRPIAYLEDMADIGTNQLPVLVGDWKRAYILCDRTQMTVTVDPVTNVGKTKFYVRRRVYGQVMNNDALKALKTTIA